MPFPFKLPPDSEPEIRYRGLIGVPGGKAGAGMNFFIIGINIGMACWLFVVMAMRIIKYWG